MTRQEAAAVHAALTELTARAERAEAALRARRPAAPVIDLADARRRAEARYVERMRDAT